MSGRKHYWINFKREPISRTTQKAECKSYVDVLAGFCEMVEDVRETAKHVREDVALFDAQTQDILHRLELEELSYHERARLATDLRDLRINRRAVKETMERVEPIAEFLKKNLAAVDALKKLLSDQRKLEKTQENRVYGLRTPEEVLREKEAAGIAVAASTAPAVPIASVAPVAPVASTAPFVDPFLARIEALRAASKANAAAPEVVADKPKAPARLRGRRKAVGRALLRRAWAGRLTRVKRRLVLRRSDRVRKPVLTHRKVKAVKALLARRVQKPVVVKKARKPRVKKEKAAEKVSKKVKDRVKETPVAVGVAAESAVLPEKRKRGRPRKVQVA